MISGFFFLSWRFYQLVTLVPVVGMLSWFVHAFTKANQLTPNYILVLFIVSTLGLAWVVFTTVLYRSIRHSGGFLSFVDACFVGAFIAGVYYLRDIAKANCSNFSGTTTYLNLGQVGFFGPQLHINKSCAMLKASFALAIINILLFAVTFLLALLVWRNHHDDKPKTTYTRHSRRKSGGERSPRRSHHSHRSPRREGYV